MWLCVFSLDVLLSIVCLFQNYSDACVPWGLSCQCKQKQKVPPLQKSFRHLDNLEKIWEINEIEEQ